MFQIFQNMKPYWKSVVVIFILLIASVFCDMALPEYTSSIIDVGIQNSGIESPLPARIDTKEYGYIKMFLSEDESSNLDSIYQLAYNGLYYEIKELAEEEKNKYENDFITPFLLSYQMSQTDEESFRNRIGIILFQIPDADINMSDLDKKSFSEILMIIRSEGIEVPVTEILDAEGNSVTYADLRPFILSQLKSGTVTKEQILSIRSSLEESLSTMGEGIMNSMGIAYAKKCDTESGINLNDLQTSYLLSTGVKMLSIALVFSLLSIIISLLASKVGAGIGRDLRMKVFQKVMSFSNGEIDTFSTASLITRSTNDIQQVQIIIVMLLRMLLNAPITAVVGIMKIAKTGSGMGWIIVLAVSILLSIVAVLMVVALPKFTKMQNLIDRVNLVSREILTGLPVIRAFNKEKFEEQRFDEANKELTRTMLFTNRVMSFMMPSMQFLMTSLSILIVWVGSHKINDGTLQVGAMTAFITYSMMIVFSFLAITALSIVLPRAGVAAKRVNEVINTEISIKNKNNAQSIDNNIEGIISFNNVSFKYDNADNNVLSNISFSAKPGEVTAIIGGTGSGKSTLVNLIPRLYDITEGSVTIDNINIKDIEMTSLRNQIGLVPQKGVLFSGTIDENLRFGKPSATEEEIKRSAEIAQASDFIEQKEDNYKSHVAQGGSNFSGGQKQRLSIARAIAKNPKIYIFDDSFSALDLKTDAKLRSELLKYTQNATVIIVAQRIGTIKNADQIIVLDEGKIVGKGTHKELLNNCDVYLQIAKSQFSDEEIQAEAI